jgi:hypothetical protein
MVISDVSLVCLEEIWKVHKKIEGGTVIKVFLSSKEAKQKSRRSVCIVLKVCCLS